VRVESLFYVLTVQRLGFLVDRVLTSENRMLVVFTFFIRTVTDH
jgi:hypothetical protein